MRPISPDGGVERRAAEEKMDADDDHADTAGLRAERDAYRRRAETAERELADLRLLRTEGPPWLAGLIAVFGWQGGTWTDALREVKRRDVAGWAHGHRHEEP